jgi:cell division septal protein FtsQ
MSIDPRMAARRKRVAETRARLDLRRFLWVMVGAAGVAFLAWFLTSPILSVDSITVFGATNADPMPVLAEQQVVEGRPLIAIRPGRVAEALESDPWIRAASVELVFPDRVEVNIDERIPVAWVSFEAGWALVDVDGVAVQFGPPPGTGATIRVPGTVGEPSKAGQATTDQTVLGALEFVAALPGIEAAATSVFVQDDELWATVGERRVRLGRPIEMRAKAAAVLVLLDATQPGVIDVIAPTRPAIWSLQPVTPEPAEEPDNG